MNAVNEFSRAYVLHRRPFRETSVLVALWVEEYGLVRAVVKGVTGQSKSAALRNAWLQPFQLIQVRIRGNHELKTIYQFEPVPSGIIIKGEPLFACSYINQLLLFTLNKYDPEIFLFRDYQSLLQTLSDLYKPDYVLDDLLRKRQMIIQLRLFEQRLLEASGYAFDWTLAGEQEIQPELCYEFEPGDGFCVRSKGRFSGRLLLSISHGQWDVQGSLGAARAVLRLQLEWALGRKLHSQPVLEKTVQPENDQVQ